MFRNLKQEPVSCGPVRRGFRGIVTALAVVTIAAAVVVGRPYLGIAANAIHQSVCDKKTVADRVHQYAAAVQQRLGPAFARTGVPYPPSQLALLGFKRERRLEVYAAGPDGAFRFVRSYPIKAASGTLGPKLRQGDAQVPEGMYAISFLNPNSLFHLSLRVDYPNRFDHAQAARDGRDQLGGDIMIHGSNVSSGCLAMGDEAAEDLFVLAALTGIKNIRVVLSPVDFRAGSLESLPANAPVWTQQLYGEIRDELSRYRVSLAALREGTRCSTT